MALVSVPKRLVTDYQKLAAKEAKKQTNEMMRHGFEVASEDAGRALLHVLQPYLKGDISMLHIGYGYGSYDLIDDGDGFLRMDIPDKYLSVNLPREYGTVTAPAARALAAADRAAFYADLTRLLAWVTLFPREGAEKQHADLMIGACAPMSGANPKQADFSSLKATRAQILAASDKISPIEAFEAAERIGDKIDDEYKLSIARALHVAAIGNVLGLASVEPVLTSICTGLGVAWKAPATFTIDPLSTHHRAAYRAHWEVEGKKKLAATRAELAPKQRAALRALGAPLAPKRKSFWARLFGG